MTLTKNQEKTGFPREDSPNTVKRTGRGDGSEGAQKKTGHLSEDSAPIGGRTGRDSGFAETQGKTGFELNDSPPDKGSPSGEPARVDEVKEI